MFDLKFLHERIRVGIVLLIILPPVITALYIAVFGVNVLYWDQWNFFNDTLSHWYNNSLSFQDLFSQHNEHRILFPKLVMIGIAIVTSYNTLAEMACSYVLLLLNLILIYKIFMFGKKWSWDYLMLFVPVAWLLCSVHQWENLLWGFQIQIFLCVTGFLLAILFLERCKGIDWNLAAGILGGIISSFSFMNGLMVWPAGLVLLLLKEKRNPRALFGWLIAAVVTTLVFFNGWVRPEYHPSPFYFLSKPFDAIGYFLVITASSFGFSFGVIGENVTLIGGVIFLLILGFVLYRVYYAGIIRTNAAIIAVIVFPLLSEVMLTFGRGGFGIIQASSSRYVTFTVFGMIGTYLLFIRLKEFFKEDRWVKGVFYLFCILIFAGIIIGMMDGFNSGGVIQGQREEMRDTLISYQTASDSALKMLNENPKLVRDWAPVLKKYQLNVFAGD